MLSHRIAVNTAAAMTLLGHMSNVANEYENCDPVELHILSQHLIHSDR